MKKKNSVAKNYIFNVTYKLVNIIIPLITAPYLSRIVGAEGIGTYAYYYSIAHYFYLFGKMGLNNYGTREIAINRENKQKLNKTFSSIYLQQILIGLIMLIIYIIFSIFMIKEDGIIPMLLGLYTLGCLLDIDWLYLGLERFDKIATKNIFVKIITLILIFIFVKDNNDLWIYTLIMSAGMLIGFLTLWTNVRKIVKITRVPLKESFKHFKPNFILMFPVLAVNIYRSLDKVMVGKISGMVELGYYDNAEKIIYAISSFITAFDTIMMPRCSKLLASGKIEKCKDNIMTTMKFLFFCITLMASVIFGISETVTIVAFGNEFTPSIALVQILLISLLFMVWSDVIRSLWVIPQKKDYIFIITIFSGAVINFILNLILIPKMGALGACIGTVIAELTVPIAQFMFFRKELNYLLLLKKQLIFIFSGLLNSCILFSIQKQFEVNLLNLILLLIIGTISYLIICIILHLIFNKKELFDYISKIRSLIIGIRFKRQAKI